ncbi:MAG: hypothetical protein B6I36_04110 [Desulfobacteraceae bacterium 4572_35.1]|nr:MAG: hypothetical protein B6I36_04110 [Desulfobacteraceae bacterium 4572_35.1]
MRINRLTTSLTELAESVDDLLEALSALQQLSELPAHKLTETTLSKELLHILYQCCQASSCTVFTWTDTQPETTDTSQLKNLWAIDFNGISHPREATRVENHFINNTIKTNKAEHCSDCTAIAERLKSKLWEKSIISVPVFIKDQLYGVITISHSEREHFNPWSFNLMLTISKFFGYQLSACRLRC